MKKLFRHVISLLLVLCMVAPAQALTVEQALELLNTYYIDQLPEGANQAHTVDELLAAVGDPYTTYMSSEAYQTFLDNINGSRLIGIGVSIEVHPQGMLISSVIDGSPAQEAALEAGDIILTVDGVPLLDIDYARTLLSGEEGSYVTLTVLKLDGSISELTLVRREILIPSTMRYNLSEDGNACVILCSSFGETTPDEFADLMENYEDTVNAWIIDLSTNPGGTSQSGSASAGCFIGSGTMLYFRDGEDNYSYTFTLPGTPKRTNKPAILLSGPYTASSAELFMAAIRDHHAGISMGQRSYGKGVAQIVLDETTHPDLFSGDALKVTVYRFFSPDGVTNDQIGVFPTLLTSLDKTYAASLLLCADAPETPAGHLKIALSGWEFFIHLDTAMRPEFRPAFVELLEALPPIGAIFSEADGHWQETDVDAVVAELELTEYHKRSFTDLEGCAQAQAIQTLCTYDLVSGYGDGTFHPDATLTRAEFCAILGNLMGLQLSPVPSSRFSDVDTDSWYASVVHAMCDLGLLSGYPDGTFHPDAPITQEEAVSILAHAAVKLSMHVYNADKGEDPTDAQLAAFQGYSDWARRSAWILTDALGMDLSALSPQADTSRAQSAELVYHLLTQVGILWQ